MINSRTFDPATESYVSLATYRRTGEDVKTPVWIAGVGNLYYVFSAGNAGKVKRIRVTPRIRMAACDIRGKVTHCDWIEGTALLITDPVTIAAASRALRAKYGLQIRIGDFFARLSGRIHKRAYIEITLS
jgi:PPOX class probable F420-dependent enzyme